MRSNPAVRAQSLKHGEAGAGSGGDEEDEGGRHRGGQSPHQGLYNIIT